MNRERFAQEVLALCIYADLVPSEEVKKIKNKKKSRIFKTALKPLTIIKVTTNCSFDLLNGKVGALLDAQI